MPERFGLNVIDEHCKAINATETISAIPCDKNWLDKVLFVIITARDTPLISVDSFVTSLDIGKVHLCCEY